MNKTTKAVLITIVVVLGLAWWLMKGTVNSLFKAWGDSINANKK